MPNYGLVINSRFKPFSLQELWAPAMEATKAHQALEESYGALGTQAGTVEAMLNKELDRDAYNQYQGYMKGLQEQADLLATQGLNPSMRNTLMNLRQRYSQEIIPIQKAAERREKLADEQRKLGNSMIFDIDAATTGLDKFMNNPSYNYRSIDRTDLLKRSQVQFGQFANELMKFQEDPSKYKDAFHKTLVSQYGFTPDEASQLTAEIATGNITSNDAVARVANNLYNSTGVDAWNNEDAKNAVWSTIAEGAVAGIGKMTPQVIKDEKAIKDYEYQQQINLLREKHRIEQEEKDEEARRNANKSGAIIPLRSRKELTENAKKIEEYSQYFKTNPDGTLTLTPEGWKNMYTYGKYTKSNYSPGAMPGDYRVDADHYVRATDFGKFMEELNGGKPLLDTDFGTYWASPDKGLEIATGLGGQGVSGSNYIGGLFSQYISDNKADAFDTYRTTEIDIPLDNPQGETVTEAIFRSLPKGAKIEEVDFDGNKREWTSTGNTYSPSDLAGYEVSAIRPSRYGMTAFLHKDGQEDIRIKLPKNVNIGNLEAIHNGMIETGAWVQAAYSEYKPMLDEDNYIVLDAEGNPVFTNERSTKEDRQIYWDNANEAKANTVHNSVTIVRPATTTTEKH